MGIENFEYDETEGDENETIAKELNRGSRFLELCRDSKVHDAAKAIMRTAVNIGVSLADTVPVIGDFISWLADSTKVFKATDVLTPDVSRWVAWGSEALEPLTGGVLPSHAIETTLQFLPSHTLLPPFFPPFPSLLSPSLPYYPPPLPPLSSSLSPFFPPSSYSSPLFPLSLP